MKWTWPPAGLELQRGRRPSPLSLPRRSSAISSRRARFSTVRSNAQIELRGEPRKLGAVLRTQLIADGRLVVGDRLL